VRSLSALVLLGLALDPGSAHAQCAPPDLLVSLPADGATGLPTEPLFFRARYAPTAVYRGEPVTLERVGGAPQELGAFFEGTESTLGASPEEPLTPSTSYLLRWPPLADADETVLGEGREIAFTTGPGSTVGAPAFGGIESVAWDAEKARDDCVGSSIERYVFELHVGEHVDESGPGTVEALVFLSESPARDPSEGPELVGLASLPAPGDTIEVRLPRDESIGRVCFSAVARDVTGFFSTPAGESCVQTEHPPFFGGCAAGGPGAAAFGIPIVLALVSISRRRDR
jgi:hypothetical protein